MSEYWKSLEPNDAQSYIKKLTLTTGECLPDPYALVAEEWEENINKFPDITWRNVTEYLIKTPSLYTKESMKAYKSLEAFDCFVVDMCSNVYIMIFIQPANFISSNQR